MPRDRTTPMTIRDAGRVGVYPPGGEAFSVPADRPALLDYILAARGPAAETAAAARDAVAAALGAGFGAARPADLDGEDYATFVQFACGDADPAATFGALLARYRRMAAQDAADPA